MKLLPHPSHDHEATSLKCSLPGCHVVKRAAMTDGHDSASSPASKTLSRGSNQCRTTARNRHYVRSMIPWDERT